MSRDLVYLHGYPKSIYTLVVLSNLCWLERFFRTHPTTNGIGAYRSNQSARLEHFKKPNIHHDPMNCADLASLRRIKVESFQVVCELIVDLRFGPTRVGRCDDPIGSKLVKKGHTKKRVFRDV